MTATEAVSTTVNSDRVSTIVNTGNRSVPEGWCHQCSALHHGEGEFPACWVRPRPQTLQQAAQDAATDVTEAASLPVSLQRWQPGHREFARTVARYLQEWAAAAEDLGGAL